MIAWIRNMMPVPMAAPETVPLRNARRRLIAALCVLALMAFFWGPLAQRFGAFAFAVFVSVGAFCLVQGLMWISVKNAADDEFLMNGGEGDA